MRNCSLQLSLFNIPAHVGQQTSYDAAVSIVHHAKQMAEEIVGYIIDCGSHGATCDEIEKALKIRHQTASARVRELFQDDKIKNSGKKRLTRSGRAAIVWIAL